MRHLSRARSLLAASVAFVACSTTQTDEFRALPKSQSTARSVGPRAASAANLQVDTFDAKPRVSSGRVGPGPNASVAVSSSEFRQQMEAHFIKVGQGDATLLKLPNGTNILVDAGSLLERDPQALKTYIEGHLDNDRIDTLVVTHPDSDHYNLLPFAVSGVQVGQVLMIVGQVLMIGEAHEYGASANVDRATSRRNNGFQHWLESPPTGTTVRVVGPTDIDAQGQPSNALFQSGDVDISILSAEFEHDTNSRSIVLLVSHGDFDMLLMGDAEEEVETDILGRYAASWLDVECLKLGHHGSAGGTSQAWLNVVRPEVAIASAAEGPKHGHPNQKFRTWLESHTIASQPHRLIWWQNRDTPIEVPNYVEAVYSTATNGTIVLRSNGQTFSVSYAGSETAGPGASLRIAAVLPDPAGQDGPNERVRIRNTSNAPVSLVDWRIADSSGGSWLLTSADGAVPVGGQVEVVRNGRPMSLNNEGGDEVVLVSPDGTQVDRQGFGDATEGQWISFLW